MKKLDIMNGRRLTALILPALLLASLATLCAAEPNPQRGDAGEHPGQGTPYETVKYDPASPEKMKWWEDAKILLMQLRGICLTRK